MVRYVGVTRSQVGLLRALEELRRQLPIFESSLTKREEYEFANLLTCALLTAQAALEREESRGGHFRGDYPESHNDTWIKHISFIRKEAVEECFPNV
ncbi:hypothetical protein P7H25_17590 [Paenibacillus larvae]|nr:hypothetical protein [Paenibacillus larvae]MDT2257028.1 hypothetical protein [Paenibacillus larvae]